jgi:CDP-glycerol glycerophosphotransferase
MEQKVPKNFFDGVVNANEYPDIQNLLCASDVGITDYSSWMCDYVLTKKPGFLYTPDIDYYDKERGFYYPLETTPFGASKTQEELFERINNFDQNKYNKEVDKFLKDRGCFEKGNASVRIVEKIKELMK